MGHHRIRSIDQTSARRPPHAAAFALLILALAVPLGVEAENGEQGDMCLNDGHCAQGLVCDPILSGGLGLCGPPVSLVPPLGGARKVNHLACNSDHDCPRNQECRAIGLCSTGDCAFPCGPMQVCRPLQGCVSVECTGDAHCSGVCIDNACADCRQDRDCPDRHVCRSNECRQVECTGQQHCRTDQQCIQNSCRDRCASGSRWVVAPGLPICGACVSLRQRATCANGPADCSIDEVCAEGHCIDSCTGIRGDVQALRREITRLREIVIALDGSPPAPGDPCLSCPRTVTTAPLGSMLGKAGVPQTVTVELVDRKGAVVADLGTHAPTGGGFPTLAQGVAVVPRAPLDLARNPCGYTLRMTNQLGEQLAAQSVCLSGS